MALVQVPCTPPAPRWTQRTAFDGTDYLLTFYWSQRDGCWRLDLADQSGNPLASGRKLVCNWPLLRGVLGAAGSVLPSGILAILDTLGQDLDPGYADLGTRCLLLYGQIADWQAAQ